MSDTPLYFYDDPQRWGRMLLFAAKQMGHSAAHLFQRTDPVPAGARAFVRIATNHDMQKRARKLIKRLTQENVRVFPPADIAPLYDNKLKQYEILKPYLPQTFIFHEHSDVLPQLRSLPYPLVSKTAFGSGSKNVRMLSHRKQAEREAQQVFLEGGLECTTGKQHGYVYWQEFLPGNYSDIRVIQIGARMMLLRRFNRVEVPFASGSGNFEPIAAIDNREWQAMQLTLQLSEELSAPFLATDIIFTREGQIKLLEISFAWTAEGYIDCPFFNLQGGRLPDTGAHQFHHLVNMMLGA